MAERPGNRCVRQSVGHTVAPVRKHREMNVGAQVTFCFSGKSVIQSITPVHPGWAFSL